MTQLSLMPDEVPDEYIITKKKRRFSLRAKIRHVIKMEGLYNYALMAKEALSQNDSQIESRYKMGREELKTIFFSEFGYACTYQEDIDSYLEKVKTIPGYALKNLNHDKDTHREIR